jgi:hypothetical protein
MVDEERIRKYVEKKLEARNGLLIHAAIFTLVNLLIISSWANVPGGGGQLPGPFIVTFFWGLGLFAHYMDYSGKYGRGRERRERLVELELEKERERVRRVKQKNDDLYYDEERSIRLTEDGELSDSTVDHIEDERRKRQ